MLCRFLYCTVCNWFVSHFTLLSVSIYVFYNIPRTVAPDKLSLSPQRHRVTHRSYSPTYIEQPRPKLSYRER